MLRVLRVSANLADATFMVNDFGRSFSSLYMALTFRDKVTVDEKTKKKDANQQ
jgi:hypothetical protein